MEFKSKLSDEELELTKKKISEHIQRDLYNMILKKEVFKAMEARILNIDSTNIMVSESLNKGLSGNTDIGNALSCDGFFSVKVSFFNTFPDGLELAFDVLKLMAPSGAALTGPTRQLSVSEYIFDCSTQKVLWKFDNTFNVPSMKWKYDEMIDVLVDDLNRNFPYKSQLKRLKKR